MHSDIAILGSGFAGSLLAMILHRIGRRVLLIDRAVHPRFAIGESSTPAANLVLRDLARQYDLPRLTPLTKYGPWKRAYPNIVCGLKRGFSYFRHEVGADFKPRPDHSNELLVAASSDNERSDTHWLRADVDEFLVNEVRSLNVPVFEGAAVTRLQRSSKGSGWDLTVSQDGKEEHISADFVVDSTGEGCVLAKNLGIKNEPHRLFTNSRSVFTHVRALSDWHDMLSDRGDQVADHPFCCDDAAQHHVLDGVWMWVLRFDNDVTSAGFVLDGNRHPCVEGTTPEQEWREWIRRYPSLEEMFAPTEIVEPPGRILRSGRLQRRLSSAAGHDWAALPHTAGFIDPLHSSGIAHSLCGIERFASIIERSWGRDSLGVDLKSYEQAMFTELALIDQLVAGCFASFDCFPLFAAFSMLYFAAATSYERKRIQAKSGTPWFLCADDPHFRKIVNTAFHQVREAVAKNKTAPGDIDSIVTHIRTAIAPYNHVGLFDPDCRNMYRHTAAHEV